MNEIKKLEEELQRVSSVVIISHVGPDGDTLGSMLALKELLGNYANIKKIDTLILGRVPDVYTYLPDIKNVKTSDSPDLYQTYDIAIAVDAAAIDRIGDAVEYFKKAKMSVNIDHHISNGEFGKINIIDSKASATGEIIYEIAKTLNLEITKSIAINIYTAILTDTGGLKFDNTSPKTLEICAELMRCGVKPSEIHKKCYESKPIAMVKLQAHAIDNAIFVENDKIAYSSITRQQLKDFDSSDDHIDGVTEILRQINTVEVSLVFKETLKGLTKVSFRSNRIDVCAIAKFFGGGGHMLAAGCTIEKNIHDTINEVLPIVKKQIRK